MEELLTIIVLSVVIPMALTILVQKTAKLPKREKGNDNQ